MTCCVVASVAVAGGCADASTNRTRTPEPSRACVECAESLQWMRGGSVVPLWLCCPPAVRPAVASAALRMRALPASHCDHRHPRSHSPPNVATASTEISAVCDTKKLTRNDTRRGRKRRANGMTGELGGDRSSTGGRVPTPLRVRADDGYLDGCCVQHSAERRGMMR